jgi:hypothetical protein
VDRQPQPGTSRDIGPTAARGIISRLTLAPCQILRRSLLRGSPALHLPNSSLDLHSTNNYRCRRKRNPEPSHRIFCCRFDTGYEVMKPVCECIRLYPPRRLASINGPRRWAMH